ncbi:MAG: hypothetical protein WCX47_03975 [Bacilli bacterium]
MLVEKNFLLQIIEKYRKTQFNLRLLLIALFLLFISGIIMFINLANYDNRHWLYIIAGVYSTIITFFFLYFLLAVLKPINQYIKFLNSSTQLREVELHNVKVASELTTIFEIQFITIEGEINKDTVKLYLDPNLKNSLAIFPEMKFFVKNQQIVAYVENVEAQDA